MEWISGNIFIRPNKLEKAGDVTEGHTHNFDHTTVVFKGAVRIKATLPDGSTVEREFTAPAHCLIRADVIHEITALVDHTEYWCVYSHRNAQGEVTQVYDGWTGPYV